MNFLCEQKILQQSVSNKLYSELEFDNFNSMLQIYLNDNNQDQEICVKLLKNAEQLLNLSKCKHESLLYFNNFVENQPQINIFFQVLIYSALSRSKLWYGVHKNEKDSKYIYKTLIDFFNEFYHMNRQILIYQFKQDVYTGKQMKQQQIKMVKQNYNKEFITQIESKNNDLVLEMVKENANLMNIIDYQNNHMKLPHILCNMSDLQLCLKFDQICELNWDDNDIEEMSPLFYAIKSQNMEIIKFLVQDKKVNIDKNDIQNRTPFYWACHLGNIPIIEFLQQNGCNINAQSKLGRNAIMKSCYLGLYDTVQYLLKQKDLQLDLYDTKLRSPLQNAAWGRYGGPDGKRFKCTELLDSPQIVKLLLDHGVDVNHVDIDGNGALHSAAASQGYDSISILIEYGAIIELNNYYDETPLFLSCKFGHYDCVKLLIEQYDANFQGKNNQNYEFYEIAMLYGNYEIFQYVCDKILEKDKSKIELIFKKVVDFNEDCRQITFFIKRYLMFILNYLDLSSFNFVLNDEKLKQYLSVQRKDFREFFVNFRQFIVNKQIFLDLLLQNERNKEIEIIFEQDSSFFNDQVIKNFSHFAIKWSEDFTNHVLQKMNIDIYYEDQDQNNILHFMVSHNFIKPLILLLTKKIDENISNKFIRQNDYQVKIQKLAQQKNKQGLTCLELSMVENKRDIQLIIEQFSDQQNVSFKIPQYELQICDHDQNCYLISQTIRDMDEINSKQENENIITKMDNIVQQFLNRKNSLFINDAEQTFAAIKEIELFSNVYLDLEYFMDKENGVISLIQLSTIEKDYVFDLMLLQKEINIYLRPILESSKILKIMHGSETDIKLLYSFLNIRITNLFDTALVYQILHKESNLRSLQNISKILIDYDLCKQFQKADWRIRPIPIGMLQYAVRDSSILIFLHRILSQQILQKSMQKQIQIKIENFIKQSISKNKFQKLHIYVN